MSFRGDWHQVLTPGTLVEGTRRGHSVFAHAAAAALVVLVATAGLILGCGSASEWERDGELVVRVHGLATTPAPPNGGRVSVTAGNVPAPVAYPVTLPDSVVSADLPPGDYTITYTPPGGYLLDSIEVPTKTVQLAEKQTIPVAFNVVAAPAPTGEIAITVTGFGGGAASGSVGVLRTDVGGQVARTVGIPVSGSIGWNVVGGTYDVTYTPPTGFSMAGGAAGTLTGVAVTPGGTAPASFTVQTDSTNGALVVIVTGLTGSLADGGNVVAQRTDVAGTPPDTIPVSAAGSGRDANVPAGVYSFTYTPPGGFSLVGGDVSREVRTGRTDTVSFRVQEAPTNGTLEVNVDGLTPWVLTGGSVLVHRTDAQGTDIQEAVLGTGNWRRQIMPPGTYTITYTPPRGFSVAAGVTNPVVGAVVMTDSLKTVSFRVQEDPTTGILEVTVAGLTGSLLVGGSALAHRTDAQGTDVPITVEGTGSGSMNVPAGTYTVTYTPPSGFSVTGTNTVTGKVVTAGAKATASFAVVATGFQTPNVLNNASFETGERLHPSDVVGWAGFLNANGGFPPSSQYSNTWLTRDTVRAYSGTTSVKYRWAANTVDEGAALRRLLSSSGKEWWELGYVGRLDDEWWLRFYVYFEAGWAITEHLKFMLITSPDYPGISNAPMGGFGLDDAKGLNFGLYAPYSRAFATILPKTSITTGAWHSIEIHLRQNGDALPNVAFWYDGSQITHADGDISAANGVATGSLVWNGNRLFFGPTRGADYHLGGFVFYPTRNGGNTGSGAIWLDRIAVSTRGRIGP